jgi:hypothetical protein
LAEVRANIQAVKSPSNVISVTVTDRYRYLPAEMANEIVDFVEKLNHDYYLDNIRKRLEISKSFTQQIEKENNMKTVIIDSVITQLNRLVTSGRVNQQTSYDLLLQQQKLSQVIGIFESSTNDLVNSQKLYTQALQALNFQTFPTITVLQTAMPAFRSIAYSAILYSAGSMVAVFLILVIQAYFYMQYKDYITLMLTGK